MKKILSVILCLLLGICIFAGCGEKMDDNRTESDNGITDSSNDTVRGFTGKIEKEWEEVKDDFESLEREAEAEVGAAATISRGDVENTVKEIKDGVNELKTGVNDENEDVAKKVYKDACKLEIMAKKGETEAAKEFSSLAKSSKALVKQYYGVADEDYDTVSDTVNKGIKKIENFTDDVWNAFIDLFK